MVYQFNKVWFSTMADFINTEIQFMINNQQNNHFYVKMIKDKQTKKYHVQLLFFDESNNNITMTSLPMWPKRKAENFYKQLTTFSKLIKPL